MARALSPGVGLVVLLAGAFGFIFAIEKTKHSSAVKRDLSTMGKWLFGIANVFLQSSALMITLAVMAVGIFSAFILHDLKRVRDGIETNYISATLGVYLSLYNVLQSLLAIFGIAGGRDE